MRILVQTIPAWLVFAFAGFCAADSQILSAQSRPVMLDVQPLEKVVGPDHRTSIVVRLLDSAHQPVIALRDIPIEILRRANDGQKMPFTQTTLHKGQTSVNVALPPFPETGLAYIWARNPELRLGGGYIRVREKGGSLQTLPLDPVEREWEIVRANGNASDVQNYIRKFPAGPHVAEAKQLLRSGPANAPKPPSIQPPGPQPVLGRQLALRYSPERSFLANGRDSVTIQAFLLSQNSEPAPPLRLNIFDSSGTMQPRPLVIPAGEDQASATLTYDHVGMVKVQLLSSNPPIAIAGDSELKIQFDPPVTGVELTANPRETPLVESTDLVATLVDDAGKPIATQDDRVITFTRSSDRGEIQKTEIAIPAGKAEARTRFTPTWWGAAEVTASTPNLRRATVAVQIFPPWGLLTISLLGGVTGAGLFLLRTPSEKTWRIPIGALAGLILFWAVLYLGLAGLSRTTVLNPLSIFVISTIGGWAGPRVLDALLDHLLPSKREENGNNSTPTAPKPNNRRAAGVS